VAAILSSASTKVLVNGRLDRRICHACGLRQGGPLSPLLFVIVMEVLNAMIQEADRVGLLSPLPGNHFGHRMSLYADDLSSSSSPDLRTSLAFELFWSFLLGHPGWSPTWTNVLFR
jgi:hypothetical protein